MKARFEAILDIAENTQGEVVSADEAEQRAIEQMRSLGNELLHDWAKQRVTAAANELKDKHPTVVGNGKKNSLAHDIWRAVRERLFLRPKQQLRPFSSRAGIHCRSCSLLLQRVIVDFGADTAFGRVPGKLQEHYGISAPISTIRKLTEHHAKQILAPVMPNKPGSTNWRT